MEGLSAVRENITTNLHSSSFWPFQLPFEAPAEDNTKSLDTSFPSGNDEKPFLSLQLNSTYQSTYQWHDFKPPIQSLGVAGKSAGADAGIVVIRRPPQPLFGEFIRCMILSNTTNQILFL